MAVDVALGTMLEQGGTLPAHWYSDPDIHVLERERVFARTWQFVGPTEWLDRDGAYFTARAAHIPVVVVRDGDRLRAFVNVCRHRGHLVAADRGCKRTLQCPYHAWTYGLDGTLRSAPRADALGPLPEHIAASGVDLGALRLRRVEPAVTECNWKTALENTLECYHCQVAHPGFSRVI